MHKRHRAGSAPVRLAASSDSVSELHSCYWQQEQEGSRETSSELQESSHDGSRKNRYLLLRQHSHHLKTRRRRKSFAKHRDRERFERIACDPLERVSVCCCYYCALSVVLNREDVDQFPCRCHQESSAEGRLQHCHCYCCYHRRCRCHCFPSPCLLARENRGFKTVVAKGGSGK